jgi:Putative peptidoglycan binding domain
VALENVPVGTKIVGGLLAFALFLALMSDGQPDNDAWLDGEAAAASLSPGLEAGGPESVDDTCAGVDDGDGDPWTTACTTADGTADDSADDYDYDWSAESADRVEGVEGDDARGEIGGAGVGLPACDSTAQFPVPGGAVVLPSDLALPVLASAECRLDPSTGDADAVASLQRSLASCNGLPLAVDGVYGRETRGAVEDVQAGHGLAVDGVYGPATAGVMAWPLAGGRGSDDGPATGPGCGPAPVLSLAD